MSDIYLINSCPFPITNSSEVSAGYVVQAGTSWDLVKSPITVPPGTFAFLGTLHKAGIGFEPNFGWLNFELQESFAKPLQVYAADEWDTSGINQEDVHTCAGGIGPLLATNNTGGGSSWNGGLPNGGSHASANSWTTSDGHTYVLINVYRGYAAGVAGLGQSIDLPCAVGVSTINGQQTLYAIGAEPRGGSYPLRIFAASCTLPTDSSSGQTTDAEKVLQDSQNWQMTQWSPEPPPPKIGDYSGASALSRGALAQVGMAGLVYFWNQADSSNGQVSWRLLSSIRMQWNSSEIWGAPVEMQDSQGQAIGSGGFTCGPYTQDQTWIVPDVACTAVANSAVVAGMIGQDPASNQLELVLYRYANGGVIVPHQGPYGYVWPAAATEQRIPIAGLANACGMNPANVGLGVSLDWYSTTDSAGLHTWLVVALAANGVGQISQNVLGIWGTYDTSEAGTAGVLIFETDENLNLLSQTPVAAFSMSANSVPVVQRDASGRVWVLWNGIGTATWPVPNQEPDLPFEVLFSVTLPTDAAPTPSTVTAQFTAAREWGPVQRVGRTAVPFWWMSSVPQPATWVDVDSQQKTLGLPPGATVTRYPIYQFLFHDSQPLDCAVQLIGWGEQVIGVDLGYAVTDTSKDTLIQLQGIVDGPVPVPAVNALAEQMIGGSWSSTPYQLIYGKASSDGSSYTDQSSNALGMESNGAATVGFGPAWDITFNSATTLETNVSLTSGRNIYAVFPTQIDNGSGVVEPTGYAYTTQVSLLAHRFQLILPDPDPSNPSGASAASGAAVYLSFVPQFADGIQESFSTYIVTAGDLLSYTNEAITARMKLLELYSGSDYVGDVLEPNSVPLVPKSGDTGATFECSWNLSGTSGFGVAQSCKSSFKDSGWSYDTKVYAGFSAGENFGTTVAGISIGVSAFNCSVMGGVEFSSSHDSSETTDDSWQITVEAAGGSGLTWNPNMWDPNNPEPKNPIHACSMYVFTVYFLPANVQWTTELIAGLQATSTSQPSSSVAASAIDPGSMPWRIAFVVTQIMECTSIDPQGHPVFTQTYPPPSSPV